MQEYYEDEAHGRPWLPEDNIYRQSFTVPKMLVLPMMGLKILQSMGSRVMPHELHTAIECHITLDSTKLTNNDSWRQVVDWLLCAGQPANRASLVALLIEAVVSADHQDFQD
jgi:hypothetical protein